MDLVVGRVVKAHGITGEVVVEVRTDDPDRRFQVGAHLRGVTSKASGAAAAGAGTERGFVVDAVREHAGRLLLRLAGVADRDAADALRGTLFLVAADDLPPIDDPDEFYDHQLVGLSVRDAGDAQIGVIADVLHTPGGELLAVRRGDDSEVLVPFVAAIVTAVSVADGTVRIEPPPGLLDLE